MTTSPQTIKYVIRADGGVRIGAPGMMHIDMACTCPDPDCDGRAISAGFFTVKDGIVETTGMSSTLGLYPADGDAERIAEYLARNG